MEDHLYPPPPEIVQRFIKGKGWPISQYRFSQGLNLKNARNSNFFYDVGVQYAVSRHMGGGPRAKQYAVSRLMFENLAGPTIILDPITRILNFVHF